VTSSSRDRVGSPPTLRSENLEQAAAQLAPHRSLERIESTARLLLGTVGLVGAVITGFGAFRDSFAAEDIGWLLPSLIAATLGLILAVTAALGTADEVNVDDLEDVDRYYSRQIKCRGRRVRGAALALAVSLLLALLPAVKAGHGGEQQPASASSQESC